MVGMLDAANCLSKLSGPKKLATDFGSRTILELCIPCGHDG
ncbi:unnamed protein product [Arabidopsis thaliana]|uniref:Uncharacterized protein n=2 Tax=Arabidopsis TaxID=3701 RepID=A0A654FUK9_ARATH|nr:hypothetical protein ISN45_At04g033340 [Arabidopsis thaliana x Arabidopsis arenosa]VYS64539.1 unnamed protein product [Arabidopsis thaliana]